MDESGLFDTHVHLDAFESWLEEIGSARRKNVRGWVLPGVFREGWDSLVRIAEVIDNGWAAPGLHPQAAEQWGPGAHGDLKRLLNHPKVCAIGEIGLDALIPTSSEIQERAFREQLRLAVDSGLPVLIHCRRATERLLSILEEENAGKVGGIFHAFSGSIQTAERVIRLGFAIGFGGPLTYPGARRSPQVLKAIPQEWIVLETDAPDLPPHPHERETNRPHLLHIISEKVSEIREWDSAATERITSSNAARVLKIRASRP